MADERPMTTEESELVDDIGRQVGELTKTLQVHGAEALISKLEKLSRDDGLTMLAGAVMVLHELGQVTDLKQGQAQTDAGLHSFVPDEDKLTLRSAVLQALGAASTSWTLCPNGDLDVMLLIKISDNLLDFMRRCYDADPNDSIEFEVTTG
jgi:hypothetical protein